MHNTQYKKNGTIHITNTFKEWLENFIYRKLKAGKYLHITYEWTQYISFFQEDTGLTISLRQARKAKRELVKSDKLRSWQKAFYHQGEPKGSYMQIRLGQASKYIWRLRQVAKKAAKKLRSTINDVKKKSLSILSKAARMFTMSYDEKKCAEWGFTQKKKFQPKKEWMEEDERFIIQESLESYERRCRFQFEMMVDYSTAVNEERRFDWREFQTN